MEKKVLIKSKGKKEKLKGREFGNSNGRRITD